MQGSSLVSQVQLKTPVIWQASSTKGCSALVLISVTLESMHSRAGTKNMILAIVPAMVVKHNVHILQKDTALGSTAMPWELQKKQALECVLPGTFFVCRPIFLPAEGATQTKCTSSMLAERAVPPRAGAAAPVMGPYCSCRASKQG